MANYGYKKPKGEIPGWKRARICNWSKCATLFIPDKPNQLYHSGKCRMQDWSEKNPRIRPGRINPMDPEKRPDMEEIGKMITWLDAFPDDHPLMDGIRRMVERRKSRRRRSNR